MFWFEILLNPIPEMNYVDPELARKVNIGLPQLKVPRSEQLRERLNHRKLMKNNPEIEKLARLNQLEVDLEDVNEEWLKTSGPFDIRGIADYYEIFDHLYGDAYFIPRVHLRILYPTNIEDCNPVYYGNILSPEDAISQPIVEFDHSFRLPREKDKKDSLWTLVMSTPDGHLRDNTSEYVHWLVTNIPNGDVTKGDVLVPYLQPYPAKGLGYHRYVFVLYKQEDKLDLKDYKISTTKDPEGRTFKTLDFYRKFQDSITPAGLAFFQAEYDDSVREVFHKVFGKFILL